MRKAKEDVRPAPRTPSTDAARGVVRISRTVKVITPLFGGGVQLDSHQERRQLKEPDRLTPVRGAAVRGHLRFWWRISRGNQEPSREAMRAREAKVWGLASNPGAVSISIRGSGVKLEPIELFEMQERNHKWNPKALPGCREIAYGAFPLQPKGSMPRRLEPGKLHAVQGAFVVEIVTPEAFAKEAELALDCWLTFGGVGGRTRRGFGAVGTGSSDPRELFGRLPKTSRVPGIAVVMGLAVRNTRYENPDAAQDAALGKLQTFRQGVGHGREQGQGNTPGASCWPEPDEIWRLVNHATNPHTQQPTGVHRFPRAAFGMPIIFHFKEEQRGDPVETRLQPEGRERLASPLLLRPYQRPDGGYGALALVLTRPGDAQLPLELKEQDGPGSWSVQADLTPAEAVRIAPICATGQTDLLLAFLHFFQH